MIEAHLLSAVTNAFRHVFPVVGGELSSDGQVLLATDVYGTAFPIGGGHWITAGHVVRSAAAHPLSAIGVPSGERWATRSIKAFEVIESHDIAVFTAEHSDVDLMPWVAGALPITIPVSSVGYPYALNRELRSIDLRGFRGYIVSNTTTTVLPARPPVYELQFQCPRGLSGAPLVLEDPHSRVCGVVLGHATTEMLVMTDRETAADGTTTTVHERYEMLQLGIAVQSSALLPLRPDLLGKTVHEHLVAHGLLPQ